MRLTPGALRLRFSQTFGHGLRVAWFRDIVRPRILSTPPIEDAPDTRFEIHVLTSKNDWLNLVWALKSFYVASGRNYALCIHEDGSLDEPELAALAEQFPRARIIRRSVADAKLAEILEKFPLSLRFRDSNVLAPKLFDFIAFLKADRMILFDSDLLFFREPTAFLQRVEDPTYRRNAFNADFDSAYTIDSEAIASLIGHGVQPCVNTGFGLIHRESIQWDWIEEFLRLPKILDGHFWRIEQTLFALCSSRFGVDLLPDEYTLRLDPGIGMRCFRHYVGAIRHLMYGEGMAQLVDDGFLRSSTRKARRVTG